MTRSAYMISSAPLLPDKCFRWPPCPSNVCKCTNSDNYKNNYGGFWHGADLSANSPQLEKVGYKINIDVNIPSWPETKCCTNDSSNYLISTLNFTDMVCKYIKSNNDWYDISDAYNKYFQKEISNNSYISDGEYINFLKKYSNSDISLIMSCNGLKNELPNFCEIHAQPLDPGPAPTAPPSPPPTPNPRNRCGLTYKDATTQCYNIQAKPCTLDKDCMSYGSHYICFLNACPTPPPPPINSYNTT